MKRNTKIIIAVAAVAVVTVTLVVFLYFMSVGFPDYVPTMEKNPSIVRISNNTLRYELTWAHGCPDPNVKFSNCAFALLVNGEATQPMDLKLDNVRPDLGRDVGARSVKGVGIMNASVMTQGNVSYIVTFYDPDNDNLVGPGDYVTVQCTESLSPGTGYTLNLFVDIHSTWVIGTIYGTYTA